MSFISSCADSVATFLADVPKEIWAAAIAAGIAAYTTSRSNKNARVMLREQLDNGFSKDESRRKMDLRRDVYFPATKAVADAMMLLADLVNPAIPDAVIRERFSRTNADISGVHVVASLEALTATTTLMYALSEAFIDLSVVRTRVVSAAMLFETAKALENREIQNGDAIVQMMRQHNISGGNAEQWARIQQQWQVHQAALANAAHQRTTTGTDLMEATQTTLREISRRMDIIGPLQARALVAARTDLDLPLDEAEYLRLFEASRAVTKAALERALEQMKMMMPQMGS